MSSKYSKVWVNQLTTDIIEHSVYHSPPAAFLGVPTAVRNKYMDQTTVIRHVPLTAPLGVTTYDDCRIVSIPCNTSCI